MAYFLMVVFGSGGGEEHSEPGGLGLVTCSRSKIRATSQPKPPGNRGQGVDYSRWPASGETCHCRACGGQELGSARHP